MKFAEQICSDEKSANYKKHLKRQLRRAERRMAKMDPEGAPRRRSYKGYST